MSIHVKASTPSSPQRMANGAAGGRLLIRGGRVLDPTARRDESADVLVVDGVIAAVGAGIPADGGETVDAAGCLVVPGLIDVHVHLREPGQEDKETVATGSAAAAHGGFTGICCMPNTSPVLDTAGSVRQVLDRADAAGLCRVYPIAAITMGQEGKSLTNMGGLADAGAVAFSDDGRMVMDSLLMRRAMEYARGVGLPLTLHSIDEHLSRGGQVNEGALSTALGLAGSPAAAETIAMARDIALAELTGARVHLCHVSVAGAVELIRRAKERGVAVTGEAAPHHLALTEEKVAGYDTNFKMNPPLRSESDREALIAGIADGTLDAIATDHAPHTAMEKDLPFDEAPFGTTGLETAVAITWSTLVAGNRIAPLRWIEALTSAPARCLGIPGGSLAIGAPADIAILDPRITREVRAADMRSKGKNSAFLGMTFSCWPVATFLAGRRVF